MIKTKQISIPFLGAALWLIIGLYQLWRVQEAPIGDFANYYYASLAIQEGESATNVYEPYLFNHWVNQRSPESLFLNYTPVPPVSILAYLPIPRIGEVGISKLVFSVIGLLAFIISFYRLSCFLLKTKAPDSSAQFGKQLSVLVILSPVLCWTALYNNFFQGQSYLYLMAFLLEGYLAWAKGKKAWASLLWSIPIALKIFPAILLLFLWIKKDYQTLARTMVFALVLSLSPLLIIPFDVIHDYFTHILPRLFAGEINDPFTILYQSARVLLDKLFVFDQHLNSSPLFERPSLSAWLYLLFQWLTLGLVWSLVRDDRVPPFAGFALVLLGGLLISGYGSSYSMLILLLPLLATPLLQMNWSLVIGLTILLFLAGNFRIYLLQDWPIWAQFPRFFALTGGLLLIYFSLGSKIPWKVLGILGFLLLTKHLLTEKQLSHQPYFLPDGQHGIIYDYDFDQEHLHLIHLNGQGFNQVLFPHEELLQEDATLTIKNNQIYLGQRQISFNKSRKRRPIRINNKDVLYLSDEGRGVGFYTLRKIAIP